MRAIGHGGQVLVSAVAAELVREDLPQGAYLRELGVHRLKDLAAPEHVFQLCHPDLRVEFPPAELAVGRRGSDGVRPDLLRLPGRETKLVYALVQDSKIVKELAARKDNYEVTGSPCTARRAKV